MAAQTTHPTGDDFNPMEARLLDWVCGEASPTEAAELEQLTAAHPEWAALRREMLGAGELLAAAATHDPEPLRLSPKRRRRLLRNLMPRKNLMYSAAIAVSLIAGVALYGERTHYVPPVRPITPADPVVVITQTKIEPDPVDDDDAKPTEKPADLPDPQQLDVPPLVIANNAFPQTLEPPPIPGPTNPTRIIGDGRGGDQQHRAFNPDQLDTPPMVRYQARADFPYAMRQRGVSGEVLVDFIVDPKGDVHNVSVVHSSQSGFDESACRAVSKWKFRPGRKGGVPVFVHMQVPILFNLDTSGE